MLKELLQPGSTKEEKGPQKRTQNSYKNGNKNINIDNFQIMGLKIKIEESNRITKAEEWVSKLEDRSMEINADEQNKDKIMKRTQTSETILNTPPTNTGEHVEKRQPSCTVGGNVN